MCDFVHLNSNFQLKQAKKREFHVASAVDPRKHYVVDRSGWHQQLATDIVNKNKYLLLHGHRQSGKSSAGRALDRLLSMDGVVVLSLTFGDIVAKISIGEFWAYLTQRLRGQLEKLRLKHDSHVDDLARALQILAEFEISSLVSFVEFFGRRLWANRRVVLIIDEFDGLLLADEAIRREFLSSLRTIKSQNDSSEHRTYALVGMLAMGVNHMLKLGTTEVINGVSPFNTSEAVQPPRPTADQARTLFTQFQDDHNVSIEQEVVEDVIAMCGGHVGLLSLLGREVAELAAHTNVLDIQTWCGHRAKGSMHGILRESATVQAMMYKLRSSGNPEAVLLLQTLALAPSGLTLDQEKFKPAVDWLVAEGFIVPSQPRLSTYVFAAEVFRSLLFREFAFNLTPTMPTSPFPTDANRQINLMQTVRQTLAYFSFDNLTHELVKTKSGSPCEYAYQFSLYATLLSKVGSSGWRILCETRANEVPGNPPRLDIMIASNGERYGIELFADGDRFNEHVQRADAYRYQQALQQVLVVNFTTEPDIFPITALPEAVHVMQIFFNVSAKTMRVLSVDFEERHESDIQLHCYDSTVQQLTQDVAAVSLHHSTSPPPAFALVLEKPFLGTDGATVVTSRAEFKWWRDGPELALITQAGHLVHAVIERMGGYNNFANRYEPEVMVFAEDPRIGGQNNDRCGNHSWTLRDPLESARLLDNNDPIDRDMEHPCFVLLTCKAEVPRIGTE